MNSKLLLTTILLFMLIGSLLAQTRVAIPTDIRQRSHVASAPAELQFRQHLDTLFYLAAQELCSDTFTSFLIENRWGYVAGMNEFGDREKAQRLVYEANGTYRITEAWGFFQKAVAVSNGTVRMKMYTLNPATYGPGTLLGTSQPVKTSDLQTPNRKVATQDAPVTIFPFATPITATSPTFFVSADFSNLYTANDTVALFITKPNCGSGNDAWELSANGRTWLPIRSQGSWKLDANWALAAVIDFDATTGVHDPFVGHQGLRLFPASPNPSGERVSLSYETEKASQIIIEIFAADGKRIQRLDKGKQRAGRYTEALDVQSLSSGVYVYSIRTDQAHLMSRFVINR